MMTPNFLSSSSICDYKVKNLDGKDIGEIKDLMIDLRQGRVGYAVLAFGGFLGLGEKYFAIPLDRFEFDSKGDEVVYLNVDKDTLKDAPGFDAEHLPRKADPAFTDSVYTHYKSHSYWKDAA